MNTKKKITLFNNREVYNLLFVTYFIYSGLFMKVVCNQLFRTYFQVKNSFKIRFVCLKN